MAFEYPTGSSCLRLARRNRRWAVQFNGRRNGQWHSAEAAATAVARHETGLAEWDRALFDAPDDLLKWRPLGDSL
jgi:hypothetical protein